MQHSTISPDLGQCFSCNSNCPKRILGVLGYHLLQQILQKGNTLDNGMDDTVKPLCIAPGLDSTTKEYYTALCPFDSNTCIILITSHFHRAVQKELFVLSSSFSQSS